MSLFLGCSLSMMTISVQLLAFVVVFISQSVSHEDGARRNSQSYATVSKKFNAKLKYPKNKLSLVGPQLSDEADNNTGTVIVCGN